MELIFGMQILLPSDCTNLLAQRVGMTNHPDGKLSHDQRSKCNYILYTSSLGN